MFAIENSTLRYWLQAQAIGQKALNLPTEDARLAHWRAFDRQREAFYPWAERKIAQTFRREMGAVLTALEYTLDAPVLDTAQWHSVLRQIHKRIGHTFARTTYAELNPAKAMERKANDLWLQFIEDYIETAVADHVVGIIETTRTAIKDAIRAGMGAGEGVYELTQRIRALYLDDIIPNRAQVIARTEALTAASAGNWAAAKATQRITGLHMRKVWSSVGDNRTRPSHRHASGQERELDEPFTVGGASLMFPGDSSLGAPASEIIQCRCALTYVTVR